MVAGKNSQQPPNLLCFSNPINSQAEEIHQYAGFDENLSKYLSEKSISEMIKVNSEISRILDRLKVPMKINMGILQNLLQHHLPHTKKVALGIADNLSDVLKSNVNRKALVEATSLHDIAKVIIPENIINKAGALDKDELEIMQEHAKLSYEMLKNTDLSKETLDLIKNHHDIAPDAESDINLQILSMADIYSALREKRSYKSEMTRQQSLAIIKKETEEGKFHPQVYNALVRYAQKEEKSANRKSKWQIFNLKLINSLSA